MGDGVDLVCFGYRPPAMHAASRLGLRVFLADDKPPSRAARRRIAGSVKVALEDDPEDVRRQVQDALGDVHPRAVLAAGERGVLAAAALRAVHGLRGIDPETAWRARDKPTMKAAARAAGIPCTDWLELAEDTTAGQVEAACGLPAVLKYRAGSGTKSLIVARTEDELRRGLDSIPPTERGAWMAERFVRGDEMSVESFIRDGRILFTNPTEYYIPGFASLAPAALEPGERDAILDLNARAIRALGVRHGMTHLELYRTAAGPLFGEVAVRPPGGRLMRLIRRAYGFDPWEVVLQLELDGPLPAMPAEAARTAGAWMLHPGPGRVVSVRGLAAARRVKGVRKLVCRARAGKRIAPRASTGSDVGWLEVSAPNRDKLVERMEAAHGSIRITMEPG